MSLSAKREALARIHGRYQPSRSAAQDAHPRRVFAICGYHRKAALRLLSRPLPTLPPKQSGPKVLYDSAQVLPVLKALWLASDQLCSKLLKAALPEWLAHYARHAAPLPEALGRNCYRSAPRRSIASCGQRGCSIPRRASRPPGPARSAASRRADALGPA